MRLRQPDWDLHRASSMCEHASQFTGKVRRGIGVFASTILACFASLWIAPTAVAGETLKAHFYQALQVDPDYNSARASYEAERESLPLGRAGLLPSLDLSGYQYRTEYERRDLLTRADLNRTYDNNETTLRFAQPLFDMQRWSAYQEGELRAERAVIVLADARQDLMLRLAQAWFNYLLSMDTVDLAKTQSQALVAQRIRVENLYRGGSATVTDVEESRAREQLAAAQELAAKSAFETRKREFSKFTGVMPVPSQRLTSTPLVNAPEPADVEQWVAAARAGNLKALAQQMAVAIAEAQLSGINARFLPSISFVASKQQGRDPNYFTASEGNTQYGVQLAMNLFEGGRTVAAKRQAAAQRDKARSDLESLQADAGVRASQSYFDLLNAKAQLAALEQGLRSAQISLVGMEVGQRAGLRTNSDVLNAQQQVFSTRRELQKERYGYLMNRLLVLAAVGALTDEQLSVIDGLASAAAISGDVTQN